MPDFSQFTAKQRKKISGMIPRNWTDIKVTLIEPDEPLKQGHGKKVKIEAICLGKKVFTILSSKAGAPTK